MKLKWFGNRADANGWGYSIESQGMARGSVEYYLLVREPGATRFTDSRYSPIPIYNVPELPRSPDGSKSYAKRMAAFHADLVEEQSHAPS